MRLRILLFALLAPALAYAQDNRTTPSGTNELTVQANLVSVVAVARDSNGHLLSDLTKDDFQLKEDGQLQEIRYLNSDDDLPLRICLMVDTSSSQIPFLDQERSASHAFLQSMITRPEDRASIIQFDYNVLLLQPMTSDIFDLLFALPKLSKPHPPRKGPGGGTLLYDALVGAARLVTAKEGGSRALIVLTDGEDNGSINNVGQALATAQLANTTIYTVLYSMYDPGPPDPARPRTLNSGRAIMQHLSDETGGRLFVTSKKLPIETIYAEIAEELRRQYRLGYTPPPSPPGKYHAIEVKSSIKHVTVQARTGYFTPK